MIVYAVVKGLTSANNPRPAPTAPSPPEGPIKGGVEGPIKGGIKGPLEGRVGESGVARLVGRM